MKGKHHSKESNKKNSDAHKGKTSGMKGKHHTQQSKNKIIASKSGITSRLKGKPGHTQSEQTKNKILNTMNHHICKDITKKKIGAANKGKLPSTKVGYGKRSYYQSPLQGQVCFRSSYELAYAKYLDSLHELWMYEMETFDLGDTTYTPDFFLPRLEQFVEIKGYIRERDALKINQFKEQYPWNLEIIRLQELKLLGVK